MHIVLVNRWYPPHTGFGGVAVYQYYLAHALVAQGHQVTVLAARWSKQMPDFQDDEGVKVVRLLAVEWSRLKRLPLFGRYIRPLHQYQYGLQVSRKLSEIDRCDRPDVIEFAEVNAEGYHYLRQVKRSPVVVRCHTPNFVLRHYYTSEEMPFDTRWTGKMETACILNADTLSAPSKNMAQVIRSEIGISKDPFTIIPNALDTNSFIPKETARSMKGEIVILHVGRLERVKGIDVLAQAFSTVHRCAPNTRLVFVGDDRPDGKGSTWRTRLAAYFQAEGLSDAVQFTGGIDQDELLRWYSKADIVAVPSMLYESFSYTSAQAMAAGLPVVASGIGGIPETVGDAGIIARPADVQELADALLELTRNESLRLALGQKAQYRANEFFNAGKVASQTLKLYRQL
jgi:glycosyltransferase involved in cell wall biosynthesis